MENIEIQFIDRIKHVHSHLRTPDEELAFGQSIEEPAETIEIVTEGEECSVTMSTQQAIYHFHTFRTHYVGHASRVLVSLLEHFQVSLPINFIIAHQTFIIYLTGNKIVAGEAEYLIAERDGGYELVEPVEWFIASSVLDTILYLAKQYEIEPVEIVENAVKLVAEARNNADVKEDAEAEEENIPTK